MREMNLESWIGNVCNHLQQLSKGALASLFTFVGYGLAKRLLGSTSADTQVTDLQDQALTSSLSRSFVDASIMSYPSLSGVKEFAKSSSVNARNSYDIKNYRKGSFEEVLAISFHDKIKSTTPVHILGADNHEPEDMTIIVGEEFRIKMPGYKMDADGKTRYFGRMTAIQEDGSPLPA